MSRPRLTSILALLLAALACSAAAATAAATPLTTTTGDSRLAALGGWLVWSEPGASGWALVGTKDGVKRTFPVAARPQPFDADLGTDARGAIVATFTRCAAYPGAPWAEGDRVAQFGRGCHVRVLDLATGRERAAGIPRPRDASDAAPSMWRGAVAFARSRPADRFVQRIWRFHPATRRLEAMPAGPVPRACPFKPADCRHERYLGQALSLDLGARLLTYQWLVIAPSVAGSGGSQVVQAIALKTRHVRTVGAGTSGEACTGGIDGSEPEAPVAVGLDVWYLQRASACTRFYAWAQRGAFGGGVGQARLPDNTLHATTDGQALYLTLAPDPPAPAQPGLYVLPDYRCDRPGAPCPIERVPFPALTPLGTAPVLSTF